MTTARPRWRRYGVAVLALVSALMFLAAFPAITRGPGNPVLVCLFAVLLAAWYGGFGPGLMVTAVISLSAAAPISPLWEQVRQVLFLAEGVAISALVGWLHANRRRAEASEERTRSIVANVVDGLIIIDEAGVIQTVNPVIGRIFGYSDAELIGRNISMLMPEPDRSDHDGHLAAYLRTGEAKAIGVGREVVGLRKDGSTFPMDLAIGEFRLGKARHFTGTIRDITEPKRTEEALRNYAARLEHLREIDLAILSTHSPREIAGAALQHLARFVPCWTGGVALLDFDRELIEPIATVGPLAESHPPGSRFPLTPKDEPRMAAARAGRNVVVEDVMAIDPGFPLIEALRDRGLRSYVHLPLRDQDELLGILLVGSDRPAAYTPEHLDVTREVANQLAIAIHQALLFDEVRKAKWQTVDLARRLLRAEEDERRRIARELHDEVGQSLTAAKIHLRGAGQALGHPERARAALDEAAALVDRTLQQVRGLSLDLRPSVLDDLGLVAALRSLAQQQGRLAGCAASFAAEGEARRLEAELETACFRVAQEALTNIVRYSRAHAVDVVLRFGDDTLELLVRDDGVGFDPAATRERAAGGQSLGVLGMQERVEMLGGRFEIRSTPGKGAEVHARFPLNSLDLNNPRSDP